MNKNVLLLMLSQRYPGYDSLHLKFATKELTATIGTTTKSLPPPTFELDPLFDFYEFEYIEYIKVNFKTRQIKIVGDKIINI